MLSRDVYAHLGSVFSFVVAHDSHVSMKPGQKTAFLSYETYMYRLVIIEKYCTCISSKIGQFLLVCLKWSTYMYVQFVKCIHYLININK